MPTLEGMGDDQVLAACERLGVRRGASREEIRTRYLALVKEHHPDLGGDPDRLADIAEAYELLISGQGTAGKELALKAEDASMVRLAAAEQRRERRDNSDRVMRELVRHQASPLTQAARQTKWLAVGSAGLATLVGAARTLGLDRVDTSDGTDVLWLSGYARLAIMLMLGATTAVFALLAWKASARAAWIESALQDADDTLTDKNSYLALVDEVSADGDLGHTWTRNELIDAVRRWSDDFVHRHPLSRPRPVTAILGLRVPVVHGTPLATLAYTTGPVDFAKLVIAKGLESELLTEHPTAAGAKSGYCYALSTQ